MAVGRSENPGVPVLFGGHNLTPLVEIGLTDLPKSGSAMAPPASPGTTGLHFGFKNSFSLKISLNIYIQTNDRLMIRKSLYVFRALKWAKNIK